MSTKTKLFGIEVDKVSIEKQTIDDIDIIADLYYDPLKVENKYVYRYCLDINLINSSNENKEITVILFNPSEYNLSKNNKNAFIDKTITNVIKMINDDDRFGKIRILNLFPTINSTPDDLIKNQLKYSYSDKEMKEIKKRLDANVDILENIKNSTVFLAWGQLGNKIKLVKEYKASIYKKIVENNNLILIFCPSKKDYPKHPGRLDLDCCRNCYGRSGKIRLIEFKP